MSGLIKIEAVADLRTRIGLLLFAVDTRMKYIAVVGVLVRSGRLACAIKRNAHYKVLRQGDARLILILISVCALCGHGHGLILTSHLFVEAPVSVLLKRNMYQTEHQRKRCEQAFTKCVQILMHKNQLKMQ